MKFSSILLVFTALYLLSCDAPTKEKGLVVIYDQTDSTYIMPSIEEIVPTALGLLDFIPKEVPRDAVKVVYSKIINTSVQPYYSANLASGKSFWFTNNKERLAEIETFMLDMSKGDMVLMQEPKKDFKHSYVQSCLCQNLLPLARSDMAAAILFSDVFQHSEAVSFYDYRDNPAHLYGEDFELVSEKLDSICPEMTDGILAHFSLIFVFMPQKKDDPLYQGVRRFWTRYLSEKKGATVKFVPHLNNITI